MEEERIYKYTNVYRLKDGTVKEYIKKTTKVVKNKVKVGELIEKIRSIKDQEKLRQINEYLDNIKLGNNGNEIGNDNIREHADT
jgi:hypothetical protein